MDKTILVKFWLNNIPFNIGIEDNLIKNSKSTRLLRITVDENLTWSEHANTLCNKLSANEWLLANVHSLLSSHALKNIYYAHIYIAT